MERTTEDTVGGREPAVADPGAHGPGAHGPGAHGPGALGPDGPSLSTGGARRSPRWWRRSRARIRAVRARVRRTTVGRVGWRIGVGVVGGILLVVGVIAIPGPGQGWALVFLALAVLSTEFSWAHRARVALWERLGRARRMYARSSRGRRGLLSAGLVALVAVCLTLAWWLSLTLTGLPGWVPDPAADLLTQVPGVD